MKWGTSLGYNISTFSDDVDDVRTDTAIYSDCREFDDDAPRPAIHNISESVDKDISNSIPHQPISIRITNTEQVIQTQVKLRSSLVQNQSSNI